MNDMILTRLTALIKTQFEAHLQVAEHLAQLIERLDSVLDSSLSNPTPLRDQLALVHENAQAAACLNRKMQDNLLGWDLVKQEDKPSEVEPG